MHKKRRILREKKFRLLVVYIILICSNIRNLEIVKSIIFHWNEDSRLDNISYIYQYQFKKSSTIILTRGDEICRCRFHITKVLTTPMRYGEPASPKAWLVRIWTASAVPRQAGDTTYSRMSATMLQFRFNARIIFVVLKTRNNWFNLQIL